jgi:flagellar basal-body rod protein FlgB
VVERDGWSDGKAKNGRAHASLSGKALAVRLQPLAVFATKLRQIPQNSVFGTFGAQYGPHPWTHNGEADTMSDKIFGIHGAALELRSQRTQVIISNIANAATPGYKARDIDFEAGLNAKLETLSGNPPTFGEPELLYRRSTMPSLDGNTVELGREQIAFAENALAYSATLEFVQGKVNTITRALKGE